MENTACDCYYTDLEITCPVEIIAAQAEENSMDCMDLTPSQFPSQLRRGIKLRVQSVLRDTDQSKAEDVTETLSTDETAFGELEEAFFEAGDAMEFSEDAIPADFQNPSVDSGVLVNWVKTVGRALKREIVLLSETIDSIDLAVY